MKMNSKMKAWSALNVQEETLALVKQMIPKGLSILELGAGTGRLSEMLTQAGYRVKAGDWNSEQFVPKDISCLQVDCDDPAWLTRVFGDEKYDAIVCGDLIEHLRNPFQFVNVLAGLLTSTHGCGFLFITTPNIISPASRVNLLINGNPISFGAGSLEMGHINPIFPGAMKTALKCASLETTTVVGVGKTNWLGEKSFRGLCLFLMTFALRIVMLKVIVSPVLLFVAKLSSVNATNKGEPVGTGEKGHYSIRD